MNWRRLMAWGLGALSLIVVGFYGAKTIFTKDQGPIKLVVYAFSTQEEVLTQSIFPGFEKVWETKNGRDLTLIGVFGPSATLAGQINLGAPADIALLSNEQHVNWLKVGRRVDREASAIVVSMTPMVIVTRPGNPAGIADFSDLNQPGLRLLHPDPHTSGAAIWAILAEYGSAWMESGNDALAETQLKDIWRNVKLLAPSARSAMTLFELGACDALVTYEHDARLALDRNVALEIVIPPHTITAHHVVVIVDDNMTPSKRVVAQDFINYLLSDVGQQALVHYHLRSVDPERDGFLKLVHPFTVEELGGWSRAYNQLVEELWQKDIEPYLDLEPVDRSEVVGED